MKGAEDVQIESPSIAAEETQNESSAPPAGDVRSQEDQVKAPGTPLGDATKENPEEPASVSPDSPLSYDSTAAEGLPTGVRVSAASEEEQEPAATAGAGGIESAAPPSAVERQPDDEPSDEVEGLDSFQGELPVLPGKEDERSSEERGEATGAAPAAEEKEVLGGGGPLSPRASIPEEGMTSPLSPGRESITIAGRTEDRGEDEMTTGPAAEMEGQQQRYHGEAEGHHPSMPLQAPAGPLFRIQQQDQRGEGLLLQKIPGAAETLRRTRCQTVEEALDPWKHVERQGPCGGMEACAGSKTTVVVLPPSVEVPAIPYRYSGDDCKLITTRVKRFPLSELPLEEELNIIQDQNVGCGGVACTAYQSGKPATTRASAFCGWAAETGCGRTQVHEYPFVQEQPVTATPASTRAERRLLVDTLESSDGTGTAMSDCQSEHSLLLPALAPVPSRLPGDMASSAMAFSSFSAGLNENDEQFAPPPFVPVDGLPMISLASVAGLAGGPAPTGWGEERHRSESLTMA